MFFAHVLEEQPLPWAVRSAIQVPLNAFISTHQSTISTISSQKQQKSHVSRMNSKEIMNPVNLLVSWLDLLNAEQMT